LDNRHPTTAIFAPGTEMKKIILIGLGLIMLSCFDQGECSDVSSNILKVSFYNYSDRKTKTIDLDSIKVVGANFTLYEDESEKEVELPLNPEGESVTFLFYYTGSVSTLEVKYQIKTFPLAPDCVAIDLYTVTDATGTTVKEIFFTKREITRNDEEHLKLFF
jgi:hypothetical protein